MPLHRAMALILQLLRDAGDARDQMAGQGAYQEMLGGKSFQLLRVWVDAVLGVFPEISANKYVIWVRFSAQDNELKPQPVGRDVAFRLARCRLQAPIMAHVTTRPGGARRRILVWAAASGLVALALWYFWPGGASAPGGPGGRGFRMGTQATPVSVAQAEPGRLDRTLRALGTVTPLATVTIRARVDGPLQSVNFADGQAVKAGDVLAVIDPQPF